MRRTIVITIASIAFALALPALHVDAVCAPAPAIGSAAGIRTMRASAFIIWGEIDASVPADAHGLHSYFLKVHGYFQGAGPARVEVTDTGDGDLPAAASVAGSTVDASTAFIRRFAGQDAIVFASHDVVPFQKEFQTTACTYTAYGDAAVADINSAVRRVFGAPTPPKLATTGMDAAVLGIAALALLVAGAALRRRAAIST